MVTHGHADLRTGKLQMSWVQMCGCLGLRVMV